MEKRLLIKGLILLVFNLSYSDYPKYIPIPSKLSRDIKSMNTDGGYLRDMFVSNIRTPVRSILELGSRDGIDALKLSEHYKCHVFAFECSPDAIGVCMKNIQKNPNVTLVPLAVWNKTGPISFFPMVETKGIFYNPGASSCFPVDRSGHHKTYIQKEITVQATRLDDWLRSKKIESIDMLCIDVQGSAYQVLEGMGDLLEKVQYIIVELEHTVIYQGEVLFGEVENFLKSKGFEFYIGSKNRHFGDYLFVKKELVDFWERN